MKKILIIDDEQGIRDLFTFLLEPRGYEIHTACDGAEGIECVRKMAYDLIFLDVHMPKVRGPEALKIIKQIRPEQVVIIFSSSSDPNFLFEEEAKRLGAFECAYKPCDVDEIIALVERALSKNGKNGK